MLLISSIFFKFSPFGFYIIILSWSSSACSIPLTLLCSLLCFSLPHLKAALLQSSRLGPILFKKNKTKTSLICFEISSLYLQPKCLLWALFPTFPNFSVQDMKIQEHNTWRTLAILRETHCSKDDRYNKTQQRKRILNHIPYGNEGVCAESTAFSGPIGFDPYLHPHLTTVLIVRANYITIILYRMYQTL